MATLRNNKVTGLFTNEVENNNNAVTKTYADGVLPPTQNRAGSLLQKSSPAASTWYYSQPVQSSGNYYTAFHSWARGELIVAMGACHVDVSVSTDTIHWTARTFPAPSSTSGTMSYSDGGFVDDGASGYWYRVDNQVLAFSTDTIHWALRTSGINSGGFNVGYSDDNLTPSLHYKSPYYYTSNWSNELWSSTDTVAWERRTHDTSTTYSIGYYKGYALMGGSNGLLNTTTDFYHWKKRTTTICNDTINLIEAGDYLFGFGRSIDTSMGCPYHVKVNFTTDTIHWTSGDTGFRTNCNDEEQHPTIVAYHQGRYYTAFQKADGSGGCCRPYYISSTDIVHWEKEMDGCDSGQTGDNCAGNYYCSLLHRVIANDDHVLITRCGNDGTSRGFLVKPTPPGNRQWNCFTESNPSITVESSRGSVTLSSDNCNYFNYSFPKETQYVSLEFQGPGHGGGMCIGCSGPTYQYGGRGGAFSHMVFNKCDISNYDDLQLCVTGDLHTGHMVNPNWGGVEVSQDSDLATFHKNMWSFTCQMCCFPFTGFSGLDASGNEVMIIGSGSSYPLWSSLDGGVTWQLRTGAGSCCVCSGVYVDGCPGHFRTTLNNKIFHSTDSIHWSCCCINQHGSCCITSLTYQNSAYWATGCKHLSCSADGSNWCHRTVGLGQVNCVFGADSSGGYLIAGDTYFSTSTDSIHWKQRTNPQCCITGFRYCNSTWYSFGSINSSNDPNNSWAINKSTDTIHWEPHCCFAVFGTRFMQGTPQVTRVGSGPNNQTVITIREASNEKMQNVGGGDSPYNATESVKSTTDFIHWTDLSKNLNGYRSRQYGCTTASYNCFMDIKYSSDTKRFFITSKSQCCMMTPNFGTTELGNQSGYIRIKYTLDGDCVRSYCHCASMPSGENWCDFCCATCPEPYYMLQQCCYQCSFNYLQKHYYGGDGPRAATGCPGVQTAYCGCCGLCKSCLDFGVSGASSGGASGMGNGGGSCSSLGDTPDTVVDEDELKQYEIAVSVSSGQYRLTGEDRGGTFSDSANRNLTIKSGDLVAFTLDGTVSGHPFWIKLANSTGTTDRILAKFVENNGSDSGEIILDTFKLKPGTYHYNCQYHSSMHGTITVEDAVVSLDGENGTGANYSLFGSGGAAGYTHVTGFMTWYRRTQAIVQNVCCDTRTKLAYGNGVWLHTGGRGIDTSTDTIHWTLRTFPASNNICCGNPIYGTLNGNPTWFLASYATDFASSTDAIHWTLRTIGTVCCGQTSGLAYGNNMFLLKVCCDVTASTDAVHWTLRTVGDTSGNSQESISLAYGDGLWAHIGCGYNCKLSMSTDTIHWQARTHGMLGCYVYTISHANDYWFIRGGSCTSVSTDSIHWNCRACNGSQTNNRTPVLYSGGHYLYGGVNGCLYYIKTIDPTYNASNCWTRIDDPFHNNDDIQGGAVSDSGQLMMSDGQGIYAMDNRRTRKLGGNGGNGCNGGGAGAGSMIFDKNDAWSYSGYNGEPGGKKVRITWW